MKPLLTVCIVILFSACGPQRVEETPIQENPDYLIWSLDIALRWDDFKGTPPDSSFQEYFSFIGIYTDFDFGDELGYEVTTFFNKKNSWKKKKSNWNRETRYHVIPRWETLRFQHTEIYARMFRKYLEAHRENYDKEEVLSLGQQYLNESTQSFQEFMRGINYELNDENYEILKSRIERRLKKYDTYQ